MTWTGFVLGFCLGLPVMIVRDCQRDAKKQLCMDACFPGTVRATHSDGRCACYDEVKR